MSDLENKTQEEAPKKRPYNLREKKEKDAAYRALIRPELADELYDKILNIIVVQKKYRDRDYSAKDLAKELETNTRYLSVSQFSFRNELFLSFERISCERSYAFAEGQAVCRQECGGNQYDGRFCQSSVFLCRFL